MKPNITIITRVNYFINGRSFSIYFDGEQNQEDFEIYAMENPWTNHGDITKYSAMSKSGATLVFAEIIETFDGFYVLFGGKGKNSTTKMFTSIDDAKAYVESELKFE